jgi:Xaa-Pro aminopeptidase
VGAAWERFDGIGVRIEDDYLMLPSGFEWISRSPREIDQIEQAMAEARARRGGD